MATNKPGNGRGSSAAEKFTAEEARKLMGFKSVDESALERAAVGSTSLPLGARDETWDAGAAKKALQPGQYGRAFFWKDPQGDPQTLAAYKLPFASPSGGLHAVWSGVTSAAQRLSSLQGVSDSDLAGIKTRIGAYYKKAATKYQDDTIEVPWAEAEGNTSDPTAEQRDQPTVRYAVAPLTEIEVKDPTGNYDDTWTMSGYAAVFNQDTTLYDGKFIRLTESIDPGAFNRLLRDQPLSSPEGVVHFNVGHDMNRAVAATNVPPGQPGSLQLKADPHGLQFFAKVPRDDPDGVAMASKMRTGVLRQASFAFTVAKDEVILTGSDDGPDTEHRTILEVKKLYDVCATPQGAYSQTVTQLRSLAAAIGQPVAEASAGGHPHQPVAKASAGGGNDVNPDPDPLGGIADLKAQRVSNDIRRAKARYPKR